MQNASGQKGGREVRWKRNCFFLPDNERSRSYSERSIPVFEGTLLPTDFCTLPRFLTQELSGDSNPQYFPKSTAVQMGGALPYKWEAYCSTNGRCTVGLPFLQVLEARKVQYSYTNGGRATTSFPSAGVEKNCVLPMRLPNPNPTLDKNLASMGPGILFSIGSGSGGRLLRHFQTPTLHWIHFGP